MELKNIELPPKVDPPPTKVTIEFTLPELSQLVEYMFGDFVWSNTPHLDFWRETYRVFYEIRRVAYEKRSKG